MALTQFTAGATLAAADLNAIVDMLQGASGSTDAFFFRSSNGNDFVIRLSDAAGARKLSIQDLAGVEVASIDSNGVITGSFTPATFAFPTSATPTPTTEGEVFWDTNDDLISVGDGAASKILIPTPTTTAGDIEYATGARAHARLAAGTARQALLMNAGATAPAWGDSLASLLTTQGDIPYASAANTPARLAKGTALQILRMNSGATAPEWASIRSEAKDSAGGASSEAVTWTTAFSGTPVVTATSFNASVSITTVTARSTTGATAASFDDAGGTLSIVKMFHAMMAT